MGRLLTWLFRKVKKTANPLNMYNIENRAHKIISQDKAVRAPKYESSVKQLEQVLRDNPGIVEEYSKKDVDHDKRLKNVFVSSTDPDLQPINTSSEDRPMPLDRKKYKEAEYGIELPKETTPGLLNQKQLFEILAAHRNDKRLQTEQTALKYKIPKEVVDTILKYHGAFNIYENKQKGKESNVLYQPIDGSFVTPRQLTASEGN